MYTIYIYIYILSRLKLIHELDQVEFGAHSQRPLATGVGHESDTVLLEEALQFIERGLQCDGNILATGAAEALLDGTARAGGSADGHVPLVHPRLDRVLDDVVGGGVTVLLLLYQQLLQVTCFSSDELTLRRRRRHRSFSNLPKLT